MYTSLPPSLKLCTAPHQSPSHSMSPPLPPLPLTGETWKQHNCPPLFLARPNTQNCRNQSILLVCVKKYIYIYTVLGTKSTHCGTPTNGTALRLGIVQECWGTVLGSSSKQIPSPNPSPSPDPSPSPSLYMP